MQQLGGAVDVLVVVVVELVAGHDLAGHRRPGRGVAEHGHLDLAAGDRLLDDDPLVVGERGVRARRRSSAASCGLGDADRRAQVGRLHEHGQPELGDDPRGERVVDVDVAGGEPAGLGEAVRRRARPWPWPCPCTAPSRARRRRRRARRPARAGPARCRPRPSGRAAAGGRRPARRRSPAATVGSGSTAGPVDRRASAGSAAGPAASAWRRSRSSTQSPVAGDADGHDVVAVGVDGPQHVAAETHDTSCSADSPAEQHDEADRGRGRRPSGRVYGSATAGPGARRPPWSCWRRRSPRPSAAELHGRRRRRSTGAPSTPGRSGGGELFVPIVAERDGHDFIAAAVRGRGRRLPHRRRDAARRGTAIAVADTARGPARRSAACARAPPARPGRRHHRLGGQDVDQGPAGRASWRTRCRTAASERSFNNELGVPLTLANAPDGTEAAVVEMGARGRGPHRAAVRRRPADGRRRHRGGRRPPEMFGSIDDVARAKGELVEALPARRHGGAQRRRRAGGGDGRRAPAPRCVTFGDAGGDVRAEAVALDDELRPSFRLRDRRGARPRSGSRSRGGHQVANALAAAAAALAAGCRARRRGRRPRRRRAVAVADGPAPRGVGRAGPQRRLQRQPDVDGGGARRRWPRCRPAAGSPCSA